MTAEQNKPQFPFRNERVIEREREDWEIEYQGSTTPYSRQTRGDLRDLIRKALEMQIEAEKRRWPSKLHDSICTLSSQWMWRQWTCSRNKKAWLESRGSIWWNYRIYSVDAEGPRSARLLDERGNVFDNVIDRCQKFSVLIFPS